MAPQLSDEQRRDIQILQYLSMLFVNGDGERSRVSSRQTAQSLGLNSYDVEDTYEKLARYRFVATGTDGPPGLPPTMDARLDPVSWDRNRSPISALYAHYVANAPPSLRTVNSQRAMVPTKGCPLVPNGIPASCSAIVASSYNGVFNPNQISQFCCPTQPLPPVETCLLASTAVARDRLTTENLMALLNFRILLRGLYAFGVGGMSLAEWLDRGPAPMSLPLYVLAETDAVLGEGSPVLSDFTRYVATGGPANGPYSTNPFVLTASDGSALYNVKPNAATPGTGTIEQGGVSTTYTALGVAANGTFVLQIDGSLP